MSTEAEFAVSLTKPDRERCAVHRCTDDPTMTVTLAYCFCSEQEYEHGHPDSPDAMRHETFVCTRHGNLIARHWESFQSLRPIGAA